MDIVYPDRVTVETVAARPPTSSQFKPGGSAEGEALPDRSSRSNIARPSIEDRKRTVLARLDFVAEYRSLGVEVTGAKPNDKGWIECRAKGRPDNDPSANIHVETGVYKSFGEGAETLSFFDFALKYGNFPDFISTLKYYEDKVGSSGPAPSRIARTPATPLKKRMGHPTFDLARDALERSRGLAKQGARYHSHWVYPNADGSEALRVLRFTTNTGKTFRPVYEDPDGGWMAMDPPGLLPLFDLPELAQAGPVAFFEGEKCARIARDRLGINATTTAHGAQSPHKSDLSPASDRDVVIFIDADDAGRKYGEALVKLLLALARPPRSIKVVELPGLEDGEDIEQWLDRCPETWEPEQCRAEIERLIDLAPDLIAEQSANQPPALRLVGTDVDLERFNPTDLGNARRLAHYFGHLIRYCNQYSKWLIWDGMRWKDDSTGRIYRIAASTIQMIGAEAAATNDPDQRKALLSWAMESEARKHVDAMIHLARYVEGIAVEPSELDRDPWLINVKNGTIDLQTGRLRPHRQEDLITKLAPVEFDPKATCPKWEKFELEVMDGDNEMVRYLRRIAGYGMTGDVREHQLYFFHGDGRNGKSIWLDISRSVLGDYANNVNTSLITAKQNDEHPTGLTDLEGKRFVSTVEVEDGKKLAEALVKQLTGGDPIRARRMRQDFYQFNPTHKLILAVNHKPDIRGRDEAIWERVRMISWPVTFVEKSRVDPKKKFLLKIKGIEKTFADEFPGILALMVRSCLDWQKNGMQEPAAVLQATANYRAEMDRIADFIEERCVALPGVRVRPPVLYKAYVEWSKSRNETPIKDREFGSDMEKRGFSLKKSNSVAWRLGIALRDDQEPDNSDRDDAAY